MHCQKLKWNHRNSKRPRCWTAIDVHQLECLERLLPGRDRWILHFCTVLLCGAPPFQRHAGVPAGFSIRWPQANAACLAKCNFRSHWLTAVVHKLVNKPYFIQSSGSEHHSFGLLPLTSGSPSSSPFGSTLPGLHILIAPLFPKAILGNQSGCQGGSLQQLQHRKPMS